MKRIAAGVLTALLLAGCAGGKNPSPPHVSGRIVGDIYSSSRGHFSVPVPVSPEVNGRVAQEDAESVLFRDNWGSRILFASGVIYKKSQMWSLLESEGVEKALSSYLQRRYGNMVTLHFHPDLLGGTVSCIYIRPVVPKTGVAAFISGNRVFLVETDLIPGVSVLAGADEAARGNSDEWLENRALELARSIQVL